MDQELPKVEPPIPNVVSVNQPPKRNFSLISLLKSHRFAWGIIGFFLGLFPGYFVATGWAMIVVFFQRNLELGVFLLVVPMLLIILITPLLTYYFGYILGKEKDFPEEKEILKSQRKKKFIKSSIIYLFSLFILIFLWPFLVIPILMIQDKLFPPKPLSSYLIPTPTISLPSPTPAPDTAAWETYTNRQFSFEIKHHPYAIPEEIIEGNNANISFRNIITKQNEAPMTPVYIRISESDLKSVVAPIKRVTKQAGALLLEEKEITMADAGGIMLKYQHEVDYGINKRTEFSKYIILTKNGFVYSFQSLGDLALFDKFMSTLKFLDQTNNVCEINKEYTSDSVEPNPCQCSTLSEKEIIRTTWGRCPKEGMTDCPAQIFKCTWVKGTP